MDKTTETLLRAADALDAIGRRDLADALGGLVREAAKRQKPRHKVGDQIHLKEDTALPVTAVKVDPQFGACYEVKMWVMERDLREDAEEKGDDASDHGRDWGPTPRLPAE
jgi:hypothetical protein